VREINSGISFNHDSIIVLALEHVKFRFKRRCGSYFKPRYEAFRLLKNMISIIAQSKLKLVVRMHPNRNSYPNVLTGYRLGQYQSRSNNDYGVTANSYRPHQVSWCYQKFLL